MLQSEKLQVRPIRLDDGERYRSILARTSAEDRYFRFFSHVDVSDDAFVRPFVEMRPEVVGLIAVEGAGRALGTAHGFVEGLDAELGIVVASDARRTGVARTLLRELAAELAARGVRTLTARSLDANHGFTALARASGLTVAERNGTVTTWRIDLEPDLAPVRP